MRSIFNLISAAILCAAFVTACNSTASTGYGLPKFPEVLDGELRILSDDIQFNDVNDLFSYKEYLIVVAYESKTGKNLHIYDKSTGAKIVSGLFYGRGPNEILMGALNTSFDSEHGIIKMWDESKGSWIHIDVELFAEGKFDSAITEYGSDFMAQWVRHRIPMTGGNVLNVYNPSHLQDISIHSRITVTDSLNNVVSALKEFPDLEPEDRWHLYNASVVSMSEDMRNLVVGTSFGAVLEVFSIEGPHVSCDYIGRYAEHALTEDKLGIDANNTNYGFADIDVSDGNIIAAFHGGKLEKDKVFCSNIAVWNMEGKPEMKIQTDFTIRRLAFDPQDGMLYLVVSDAKGTYLAKSGLLSR